MSQCIPDFAIFTLEFLNALINLKKNRIESKIQEKELHIYI